MTTASRKTTKRKKSFNPTKLNPTESHARKDRPWIQFDRSQIESQSKKKEVKREKKNYTTQKEKKERLSMSLSAITVRSDPTHACPDKP